MLKNRKGQGMTEYIVIIAAVVLLFTILWNPIKGALTTKSGDVVSKINTAGN